MRIEYETSEAEKAKVDLDLATGHYKSSQFAQKIAARFKIYVGGSTSSRSGVVQDERELTAAILSMMASEKLSRSRGFRLHTLGGGISLSCGPSQGYFLRRQFRRFVSASQGYRDYLLIEKILSNMHGQVYAYDKNTIVYHLCSRPFYRAIGQLTTATGVSARHLR